MSCTSGCRTRNHATWGECVRDKGLQIGDINGRPKNKAFDSEQQAYYDARKQGVQPASPLKKDVDRAMRISQADGEAWRA
jgi:hypothetical protein